MRRRKLRIAIGVVFLLLLLAWIPTGGLVLVERDDASAGCSFQDANGSSNIFLRVSHPERAAGIPLVFLHLTDDPAIFVRCLEYTRSSVVPDARIRIDEIRVVGDDGLAIDLRGKVPDAVPLYEEKETIWGEKDPIGTRPFLGGEVYVGARVHVQEPFIIQVKGKMYSRDRVVEGFDATFAPKFTKRVRWHLGWDWYFNM